MIHTFRDSEPALAGTGANGVSAAETTSDDGAFIDRQGFGGVVFDVTAVGTATADASNYWTLKVQHADDDPDNPGTPLSSSIEAAPASDLLLAPGTQEDTFGALTTGAFAVISTTLAAETLYSVGYRGPKRHVRVYFEATLTPGSTTFAVVARKCNSSTIPPE